MSFQLVVTRAFGPYKKGATITDPAVIEPLLSGKNKRNVVKINAPSVARKAL